MKKRILSVVLTVAMVITMLPVGAFAEGQLGESPSETGKQVFLLNNNTYTEIAEAANYVRGEMKARAASVSLNITSTSDAERLTIADDIMNAALAHTGQPTEGDYLKYQATADMSTDDGGEAIDGKYTYSVGYDLRYTSTKEQEDALDTEIAKIVSNLGLKDGNKTEYEKVKAIYDYICQSIRSTTNEAYNSASQAVQIYSATWEGHTTLFYRLALEAGIDARIITGKVTTGTTEVSRGWNIVKIGESYYNVDSF